jgi:protein-S-isoprenylcysteine O-methyltransferase Ste14
MKLLSAGGISFSIAQIALILVEWPGNWRTGSAVVLYVAALALFWWAVPHAARAQLNIAFTNTIPMTLLVDGPFAYVRHPFYASYLLYWLAGAFISDWMWVSVFVMGCFYFNAMRQEEQTFRLSPLAARYETYKQKTGALFPAL